MNGILTPEVDNFYLEDSPESSLRNMILSTTVELCLLTEKCQASAMEIFLKKNGILGLEVENVSQSNSIESYCRKVIVSISFELTLSNRKFQSSASRNSILWQEN
jgi:hypothetical protein